jgi:transcriptional regulator with XRE-family HTH domain
MPFVPHPPLHEHPGVYWRRALDRGSNGLGVTQAALARKIGCSKKHLNQILQGKALPSAKLTIRFADALGPRVSASRLWRDQAAYLFEQAKHELDGDE